MRINTSSNHNTISLTLCGRLDYSARHVFNTSLQESYDSNKPNIVLDLEAVTFIDSSGLGLIHRCITESATRDVNVALLNPQRQIHDILELCNMDKYITAPSPTP